MKKRPICLVISLILFFLLVNTMGPELGSLLHSQKMYNIYTVQAKGSSGFHSGGFSSSKSSGSFKSGSFSSIPKSSSTSGTKSGSFSSIPKSSSSSSTGSTSLFNNSGSSHSFIPIPMFFSSYSGFGNGMMGGFVSIFLKFLVIVVIIIVIRRMFRRH